MRGLRTGLKLRLRRFLAVLICGLLILSSVGVSLAVPSSTDTKGTVDRVEYAPDEIVLKFKPNLAEREKAALKGRYGLKTLKTLPLTGGDLVKAENKGDLLTIIQKLKQNPNVVYAEPNYKLYPTATVDDPQFGSLWGLENNGQVINGYPGTPYTDIKAPAAWDWTQGSPEIIVAVIDEGIDTGHVDIAPNIWTNTKEVPGDGIDNDGNGLIDDVNGWDFYHNDNSVFDPADGDQHGTHVAGTIAAVANNATGVVGVAPRVKIMPLKFLGPDGGYTSDAVAALGYAQKMGAKIASNSWGGGGYSTALKDAIANFSGVFVAAAGNNGQNTDAAPNYPSAYDNPNIIAVAAVNNQGGLPYWSNYGPTTVDVGAPGVDILSLKPGNSYQYMSGTSMATPHVSGVAALILSLSPSMSPVQVGDLIKRTANPLSSLQGKTVSGGMVNAYASLKELLHGGPYMVGSDPADGSSQVQGDKVLTVTFNEQVMPGPNFSQVALASGTAAVPAQVVVTGDTLQVTPDLSLATDTNFTLRVPAQAVVDSAGSVSAMDYALSFRTVDTLPPTVAATNPVDGQTGVAIEQPIAVQFSEAVKSGPNFGGITVNGQPISDGGSFQWGIDGSTLYIYAQQNYSYDTVYQVAVPAEAVTDLFGHNLPAGYAFSFTTVPDLVAPVAGWSDPEPGAAGVGLNKKIYVAFSEEIGPGANFSNISLTANGTDVPAEATTTGSTLVISPSSILAANTAFDVLVPAGSVQDLAGNGLETDYSFGFATGSLFELPFPVDDAVGDPDQPLIYLMNKYEAKLYAFNFDTGGLASIDTTYQPQAVKLGTGQFADEIYVLLNNTVPNPYSGTTLGSIAIISRSNFTIKDTVPISTDPFDLAAGRDGTFYVSSASGQWTYMDSYDRVTKALKDETDIRQMSFAKFHPTLDRIYTVTTDVSPRDYIAYNVAGGMFTDPKYPGGYDSPYHGDYPLNPYFEIDPLGKYLFNGSGTIFTTALDKAQDMRYAGTIRQAFNGIAFEQDLSYFFTTPVNSQVVNVYRGTDFGFIQSLPLADQGERLFKQGNKLIALINPYATTNTYITGVQVLDIPGLPPVIMQTDPVNKAVNQPVDKDITLTFNEDIAPGTSYDNITLSSSTGAGGLVPISKSISGNMLTISLAASLSYGTTYTLSLPDGAVADVTGLGISTYSLSFSTEAATDTTPPTVTSTDPADGASNQPLSKTITVSLSESVSAGPAYSSIVLADSQGTPVPVTQNVNGSVLTITPADNLAFSTVYTLSIPAGALQDAAGNQVSGFNLGFSTEAAPDTTAPTVTGSSPGDGETNVALNTAITITFSEPIQLGDTSSGITLKKGRKTVDFNLRTEGNALIIQPATYLNARSTYAVNIPSGAVKDASGNSLAAAYSFSFSTARK